MGKPYAGFDEAGVGNGLQMHRANPRPYIRGERGRKAPNLAGKKSRGSGNPLEMGSVGSTLT
jgi:hypothetical protein